MERHISADTIADAFTRKLCHSHTLSQPRWLTKPLCMSTLTRRMQLVPFSTEYAQTCSLCATDTVRLRGCMTTAQMWWETRMKRLQDKPCVTEPLAKNEPLTIANLGSCSSNFQKGAMMVKLPVDADCHLAFLSLRMSASTTWKVMVASMPKLTASVLPLRTTVCSLMALH